MAVGSRPELALTGTWRRREAEVRFILPLLTQGYRASWLRLRGVLTKGPRLPQLPCIPGADLSASSAQKRHRSGSQNYRNPSPTLNLRSPCQGCEHVVSVLDPLAL